MSDTAKAPPGFAEFVADRQQSLLRLAMVLCGNARLAEDIVADVLGRTYEKWSRVAEVDQPYAYVRRMVVNEYLSWRRRSRRSIAYAQLDDLVAAVPDHAEPHAERAALINQLETLPKQQRATLVLRYFEGLADSEIADLLGCAESTVRSNAARALATLRIGLSPLAAVTPQET